MKNAFSQIILFLQVLVTLFSPCITKMRSAFVGCSIWNLLISVVIIFLFISRVRYSSAGKFTELPHDIILDIARRPGMKFEDAFNLAVVDRERRNALHETLSSYPRILKTLYYCPFYILSIT